MADTKRLLSALQTLLADNTDGAISAQDLRDLLGSVMGSQVVHTVTANTGLTADYDVVLVDASADHLVISLPAAASSIYKRYTVKKVDATVNTVTVNGAGATIDGAATQVLSTPYQRVTVVCDGTAWFSVD